MLSKDLQKFRGSKDTK